MPAQRPPNPPPTYHHGSPPNASGWASGSQHGIYSHPPHTNLSRGSPVAASVPQPAWVPPPASRSVPPPASRSRSFAANNSPPFVPASGPGPAPIPTPSFSPAPAPGPALGFTSGNRTRNPGGDPAPRASIGSNSQPASRKSASVYFPPGVVVRGRILPPNGVVPIDMGPDATRDELWTLWWSLEEIDQVRVIAGERERHLSASPQINTTQTASTAPRRSNKGKKKDTGPATASNASGQASSNFRRAYVEEYDETDEPYLSTRTFEQDGQSSTRPSFAHYRTSAPAQGSPPVPTVPQGNHMGVVVLDALNGLYTQYTRLESLVNDLSAQPAETTRPAAAPHRGCRSNSRRVVDAEDGYAGDDDEDQEMAKRLQAEIEKQRKIDEPFEKLITKVIRRYMDFGLFNITDTKTLHIQFPPFTAGERKAHVNGASPPITADNCTIDFEQGWKTGDYNRDVRLFVIQNFIQQVRGGLYNDPPIPDRFLTEEVIGEPVDGHMEYLRTRYTQFKAPLTEFQEKKLEEKRERSRVNARKHTTYQVRTRTINRHNLQQHTTLFSKLKPSHMSGDEADVEDDEDKRQKHPRTYFIVDAAWQSAEFKTMVRTLDEWNISDWRQKIGDRLPGGNSPRKRIELAKPRVVDSLAPPGLCRNCYDPKWLHSLKPPSRARLNVVDRDYDFSLPTYMRPRIVDAAFEFPEPLGSDSED